MKDNTAASLLFPADDQAVRAALRATKGYVEQAALGGETADKLCIIVEELVVNIVEHGAPPAGSEIALDLATAAGAVILTLSDAGSPFDPREQAAAEVIPERGGAAGLPLVRSWASELDYERRDGRNIVRVTLNAP